VVNVISQLQKKVFIIKNLSIIPLLKNQVLDFQILINYHWLNSVKDKINLGVVFWVFVVPK